MVVNYTGVVQTALWQCDRNQWNYYWTAPIDPCDEFGSCGPYGVCDSNAMPRCSCLPGFLPKNPAIWNTREWRDGCVRNHEIGCGKAGTDGFNTVSNLKLPQSENCTVDMSLDLARSVRAAVQAELFVRCVCKRGCE